MNKSYQALIDDFISIDDYRLRGSALWSDKLIALGGDRIAVSVKFAIQSLMEILPIYFIFR